jgi:hypothetical protein
VNDDDVALRRVRFFGAGDGATGWYLDRVAELVEGFDSANIPTNAADIIELHCVGKYVEEGLFPEAYSDEDCARAKATVSKIRSAVARYFSLIDDKNSASLIANIEYGQHADLLELLARNKAFERCAPEVMLPVLQRAGVDLGEILASKKLVEAYDDRIRIELRASPRNAEYVIRKYLEKGVRAEIHLPASFTPVDSRQLLEEYLESADVNLNYVTLIVTARADPVAGIDAKLKLSAKKRKTAITKQFFQENAGFRMGCGVRIADAQDEPVLVEVDKSEGRVTKFSYGGGWLEQTCDNPSILNNFQHLFGFADGQALLTLPSYPAQLGVMERFMGATGKTEYKVGAAFQFIDMSTLLQTQLYYQYLKTKGIDLEEVFAWFFAEYLVEEFGALNFSFTPSGGGASYLQKVRHLFVEMEGVASQFALFVENGELDRDLLAVTSVPTRYKRVPSLLSGKYIYASTNEDIAGVLHVLFSDQSRLTYINDSLKAGNGADLLIDNQVRYADFLEHQKPIVDYLVSVGVLTDSEEYVEIANAEQYRILKSLFATQAVSYYHLSAVGRVEADVLISKGWGTLQGSLFTEAEGDYFNYFLNQVEFTNGPELRNKYLHGSQINLEGDNAHFQTYIIALRLTVALIIKMNDDFCLWQAEEASGTHLSS